MRSSFIMEVLKDCKEIAFKLIECFELTFAEWVVIYNEYLKQKLKEVAKNEKN